MRRFQLLTLFFFGMVIGASAQSWSVSARTGAHLAAGSQATVHLRGSGVSTEIGLWHRTAVRRLDVGLTVGHFALYGLTRLNYVREGFFGGCATGLFFPFPPAPAETHLLSYGRMAREHYWSVLPSLRYTWLDRKIYGRLTISGGGIFQPAFSRTLDHPANSVEPESRLEYSERSATLSPSVRGEIALGVNLGNRFRIGLYGGYDRTRLRVDRSSRDVRRGDVILIDGTISLHQIRAGLSAEIAL